MRRPIAFVLSLLGLSLAASAGCRQVVGVGDHEAMDCAAYCTNVINACKLVGPLAQYTGQDTCEAYCATMPGGAPGDTSGNTFGCREAAAKSVAGGGEIGDCFVAGPTGAGTCGSPCDVYCASLESLCPDQYQALGDCKAQCNALPACRSYAAGVSDRDEATFDCRMFHLTLAAGRPDPHCKHAVGDGSCDKPPTTPLVCLKP